MCGCMCFCPYAPAYHFDKAERLQLQHPPQLLHAGLEASQQEEPILLTVHANGGRDHVFDAERFRGPEREMNRAELGGERHEVLRVG